MIECRHERVAIAELGDKGSKHLVERGERRGNDEPHGLPTREGSRRLAQTVGMVEQVTGECRKERASAGELQPTPLASEERKPDFVLQR